MKRVAIINGEQRSVVVRREGGSFVVEIDGRTISADLVSATEALDTLIIDDRQYAVSHHSHRDHHEVFFPNFRVDLDLRDPLSLSRGAGGADPGGDDKTIRAVMPGRVVRVDVAEGDEVATGKTLMVIEAMKMENAIDAPWAGKIAVLHVEAGSTVETGADLVTIE